MKRNLILILLMMGLMAPFSFSSDVEVYPSGTCKIQTSSQFVNRAPGSLTTIFDATTGSAGNMFDIEPTVTLSEITAFDCNIDYAGVSTTIDIYWREGTCVGHDSDPTGWNLLGTYVATAAGMNLPTHFDVSGNGVSFDAGALYGMYIHMYGYGATGIFWYTSGGPNTYSNADLSLTTYYGKGSTDPFTGGTFIYRAWNGTVYYDSGPPAPLSVNPAEISAWYGGVATFKLNGGPDLGGRGYGLFGTTSGTSPGFPLPGGAILPINWDWFTYLVYFLSLAPGNGIVDGMLGTLDVDGMAEATLTLPGHCQLFDDILTNWAWTTSHPFDFQSNPVDLLITGAPEPPPDYVYDDGSSENALGWTAGGESVWAHYFDAGIGDTITAIQSTFGQAGSTSGPPNGDPCWLYVWNDPTNDNNPIDAVLVGTGTGVIANSATNDFNDYVLDAPTAVDGGFFVGCHIWQDVGVFAAPMDQDTPYMGEAWFMGGSVFDPNDLTTTYIYEMGSIGFPAYWLLRATTD